MSIITYTHMKQTKAIPKVVLLIDTREDPEFSNLLKQRCIKDGLAYEEKQLPVGDFWFQYGKRVVIVVERKTLDDLNSSIDDGRYHEQKHRMLKSEIPQKYYLIEGDLLNKPLDKFFRAKEKDRLYGAIVNTTIRDIIPVLRTFEMQDTIQLLVKMYKSLGTHGQIIMKNSEKNVESIEMNTPTVTSLPDNDYSDCLKVTKKGSMTNEVRYIAQLRYTTGVSVPIAKLIASEYPNYPELIKAYESLQSEKEREKLLEDFLLPSKRRLGPALSKTIYNNLYHK